MRRIGLPLALAVAVSLVLQPGEVLAKGKKHHHPRHRHFPHHFLPHWFAPRPFWDPCCNQSLRPDPPAPEGPEPSGAVIPRPLQPQRRSPQSP